MVSEQRNLRVKFISAHILYKLPETLFIVEAYSKDPSLSCRKRLAEDFGMPLRTLSARLYRAGAMRTSRNALYVSDRQIEALYTILQSRVAVSEQLGASFYTVTSALDRLGVKYPTHDGAKQDPKIKTYYFWRLRSHELEFKGFEYIVGGSSSGDHQGTIRAVNIHEALNRAPGKAMSKKQMDIYNRTGECAWKNQKQI